MEEIKNFWGRVKGKKVLKPTPQVLEIIDNNNFYKARPDLPRWVRRMRNGKNKRKLFTKIARAERQGISVR